MKKIYVAEYKGLYKIGVSCDVKKRIKQLSCGCPGIRSIYESSFLDNGFYVESKLHKEFKSYCVGGEWFSNVDFSAIDNIVRTRGNESKLIKHEEDVTELDFETFAGGAFSVNALIQEVEQAKIENEHLEKFLLAVKGVDIPNVYSDLIYEVLFGKDTERLVNTYKTSKYESFRNHLSNNQNSKIEALTKIIIGLIGFDWSFEKIKKFVMDLHM